MAFFDNMAQYRNGNSLRARETAANMTQPVARQPIVMGTSTSVNSAVPLSPQEIAARNKSDYLRSLKAADFEGKMIGRGNPQGGVRGVLEDAGRIPGMQPRQLGDLSHVANNYAGPRPALSEGFPTYPSEYRIPAR